MGTIRALTGQYLNNLERATLTSSSENALYPRTRLQINRLSKDFRFNVAGVDDWVSADLNMISNPGVETWAAGVPLDYTIVGTVVETTVAGEVRSGSAAKVSAGITGSSHYLQKTIVVRAGQSVRVEFWAKASSGSVLAGLHVLNQETGLFLDPGGTWVAFNMPAVSTTSTTYVPLAATFTVQGYRDCGEKDTVTLQLRFTGTLNAAGFAYFDDIVAFPGFDFLGVFGHTFSKLIVPELRGSTDNFVASDVLLAGGATPPAIGSYQPANFYFGLAAVQYYRYVRVKFVGTNPTAGQIGKLVIGQMQTLLQQYKTIDWARTRDRQTTRGPSGERFGHRRTLFPQRQLFLSYVWWEQAQIDDAFDCWDRADGDSIPVVVVPDSERPEVLYGYLPNEEAWSRVLASLYEDYELTVSEAPFAPTA